VDKHCYSEISDPDILQICEFSLSLYKKVVFEMPTVWMSVCIYGCCLSLLPEWLDRFYSYSILKRSSITDKCLENMNTLAPKTCVLHIILKRYNCNFLENSYAILNKLKKNFLEHHPKYDTTDGILRKRCVLGVQTWNFNFFENNKTGLWILCCSYNSRFLWNIYFTPQMHRNN
jgi:hypothetical protein